MGLTTDEIRNRFLAFFKARDHKIISSDSLIPQNDPTLLFTGAGMNQFKDYFLGIKHDMKRSASSQKCLRTGDLDHVGRTPYHHSFFEMLGNFSFGDYFKKEAIAWAWEFLTQDMKLPEDRLRVSVHEKDDEAYAIWRHEIKVRPEWIVKLGDKTNFWPSNAPKEGPNGPCGPCSEIYFDQGENVGCQRKNCNVDCDCGRFAEIWNLVFTQFNRRDGGILDPLAAKNIDTGMGLERLACVMQGKRTNFEIDILAPLAKQVISILKLKEPLPDDKLRSVYAIVDHARAATFAIHDGAIPSNEGRGYVIRKLIRRAVWHARQLGAHKAFVYELVKPVIEIMKKPYPELAKLEKNLVLTIRSEEERFLETLEQGMEILGQMISKTRNRKLKVLPAGDMFKLYDTYGFPDELTELIIKKEGLEVDKKGFEKLMDEQRARSKQKSEIAGEIFVVRDLARKLASIPKTKFLGYETLTTKGNVLFVEKTGDNIMVILDQSPFYGEGGGQVGDRGTLENTQFKGSVLDTQKEDDRILHSVKVERGSLQIGSEVSAQVNRELRDATRRNHTATHILQSAMREVLGTHVRQLGSLVNEDKLRFDFSHPKALTPEEIERVENRVNEIILANIPVVPEEKSIEEARKEGALAFFGEKYGEKVRLLRVGDVSLEFCGGTHVARTGDIGAFVITQETSIAAGTRRIEALTGMNAINYLRKLRSKISETAGLLKSTPDEIKDRLIKLQTRVKELESRQTKTTISKTVSKEDSVDWKGLFLIPRICGDYPRSINELRTEADSILNVMKEKTIAVVATTDNEKVTIIVALSKDLANRKDLNAKDMVNKIAAEFGGTGGGNKLFAQGGGRNPEKIESVININKLPEILG